MLPVWSLHEDQVLSDRCSIKIKFVQFNRNDSMCCSVVDSLTGVEIMCPGATQHSFLKLKNRLNTLHLNATLSSLAFFFFLNSYS